MTVIKYGDVWQYYGICNNISKFKLWRKDIVVSDVFTCQTGVFKDPCMTAQVIVAPNKLSIDRVIHIKIFVYLRN